MAKLLVSSVDVEEAIEAVRGGADIVDVKNPREGSLGANFPWVISAVRSAVPRDIEVSATLGDAPYLPGTISLAAAGALQAGADIVKVGLKFDGLGRAMELMSMVVKAARIVKPSSLVVAAGYSDAHEVGTLDPMEVPYVAYRSGCDIAMLDTAVKDGRSLLDHLTRREVRRFVDEAHSLGLKAALAGALRLEHIPVCLELGADIIGVRGAACERGDRNTGRVTARRVRELARLIHLQHAESEGKHEAHAYGS